MKEGWEIKNIGEICKVIPGQSPKSKFYNKNGDGLPFYQGKKEFTEKFIDNPKTWTTDITKEALKDDILMSVRAPVGPVNFATRKICIGRGLSAIRAGKAIDRNFLFYFFIKHKNEIIGNNGAVFNSINRDQIKAIKIPHPPISEQKRIVAILDEAFAALDKAQANAEKNLANAKELFESYLNGIFANPGEDWGEKKLGELFEIKSGKRVHKKDWRNNGVPFYRAREIVKLSQNGFVNNELFISKEMYEKYKAITGVPKEGDIIVSAVGTLGKCYLVKGKDKFYFKDASVLWFEKKENSTNSYYIMHALNSDYIIKQIMHGSMGATVGTLTISRAKNIYVPLPPLSEQKRIINQLDKISAESEQLESIYQQKIKTMEELKKSIFKKAFEGEL